MTVSGQKIVKKSADTAPRELIDVDGEGIYLLSGLEAPHGHRNVLGYAAWLFFGNARAWRDLNHQNAYFLPPRQGDEWRRLPNNRRTFLRLNLPRRWRPVLYAYVTPKENV